MTRMTASEARNKAVYPERSVRGRVRQAREQAERTLAHSLSVSLSLSFLCRKLKQDTHLTG